MACGFQGGYFERYVRCTGYGGGGESLWCTCDATPNPPFTPIAINADGSVIVGYRDRWVEGRGRIPFDRDPDAPIFKALSVSGDGSVAVGETALPTGYEPQIWREGRGRESLESFFAASGLDVSGWKLTSVTAISSDGTAMAGQAVSRNQQSLQINWLVRGLAPYRRCDLDQDGQITGADVALVLLDFGQPGDDMLGDLDRDGWVWSSDLALALLSWGT